MDEKVKKLLDIIKNGTDWATDYVSPESIKARDNRNMEEVNSLTDDVKAPGMYKGFTKEVIKKNPNIPQSDVADYVQNVKDDSMDNMLNSMPAMGITKAEKELGRHLGKRVNLEASMRENRGNNDLFAHMRDSYNQGKQGLKEIAAGDPKYNDLTADDIKRYTEGNERLIEDTIKAKNQFKTSKVIDETSVPYADEFWTDTYTNYRNKPPTKINPVNSSNNPEFIDWANSPRVIENNNTPNFSSDYKDRSAIEKLVYDKSRQNAEKFYNPTDAEGQDALMRFLKKLTGE
jgi:hypothetical protein